MHRPSVTTASGLAADSVNPPWFPSLMAFEHYDSARTHLFEQASFDGSWTGVNTGHARFSPDDYPTPYNVVYLGPESMFVYGGGYGDKGGTGAFVARVDPVTLRSIWRNQLIDTVETNEWDYPGVLSALHDGLLYLIYGYRLATLDPGDGHVVGGPVVLPTLAAPRDTSYNGLDAFPDGTLIAKTVYREAGCEVQGFSAFLQCPNPFDVPNSLVVAIDSRTLQVIDQVEAPEFIGGRITAVRFRGKNYAYLAGTTSVFRYLYENGRLTLDTSWNPGAIFLAGQTPPTAVVAMNDWVVVQTNATPSTTPLSVVAIDQANASRRLSVQPFAAVRSPNSFAPSSVSVDPLANRIFTLDARAHRIGALELRDGGLHALWTEPQTTTEFLALIGPPSGRVVVGTDIPAGEAPGQNTHDRVVWRAADTGRELARSPELPAVNTGTMIEPGYAGRAYYMAQNGKIIELAVRPGPA